MSLDGQSFKGPSMLAILCILAVGSVQPHHEPPFTVGSRYAGELDLVCRVFNLRGISAGVVGSLRETVVVRASPKEQEEVLIQMRDEFGVDYRHKSQGKPEFLFKEHFVSLRGNVPIKRLIDNFRPDSLLFKMFGKLLSSGHLNDDSSIRSYVYSIRPWVTRDSKRCERIVGKVVVYEDNRRRDIWLAYPE